jgi:hypothetical protein
VCHGAWWALGVVARLVLPLAVLADTLSLLHWSVRVSAESPSPNKSKRFKVENIAIVHTLKREELLIKKSKFTEAQIDFALKQSETEVRVDEICRKMGVCEAAFYNWKRKYSGMAG